MIRTFGRSPKVRRFAVAAAIALVVSVPAARAFEIKPVGCLGAVGVDVNTEALVYLAPGKGLRQCGGVEVAVDCRNTYNYLVASMANQPVHEAITRKAYRKVYGRPLNTETWVSPLLSGVVWNDDPSWMLRKAYHDGGFRNIRRFVLGIERAEQYPTERAMLTRSHFGDAQFLHAMLGTGESRYQSVGKMHAWVRAAHGVYLGNIGRNTKVADTPFADAVGEIDCGLNDNKTCTVGRLLDREQRFQGGALTGAQADTNVRWIAVGTVLHILQDAHSASHTHVQTEPDGRLTREPQTYDVENRKTHCLSDAANSATEANINEAVNVSAAYLRLVSKRASWSEVEGLLSSIGFSMPACQQCVR